MTRYPDMTYFMDLPYSDGLDVYSKSVESMQESKMWEMWLVLYPNMTKESFVSYEQFKINCRKAKPIKRSAEEVIQDAENILASLKERKTH